MSLRAAMLSVTGRMLNNRAYRTPSLPPVKREMITCPVCGRLFAVGTLGVGTHIEIKCGKCHNFAIMAVI